VTTCLSVGLSSCIVCCRRSSTGEGHFFFTGAHMRRLFEALKARVTPPVTGKETAIPPAVPPPRNAHTAARARSRSEWGTAKTTVSEVFNFTQRASELSLGSDVFHSPDLRLSTDGTNSHVKIIGDVAGYVKMHPIGSLPLTSDTRIVAEPVAGNTRTKSQLYESNDAVCSSPHTPNAYDTPRPGIENYDVPRPVHARTHPHSSSSGHVDSDDDLDFMDQWRIDQALQSPTAVTEQFPYQRSSPQHDSEIPLQSNPSYKPFEITEQANENYDYIHPSVFKSPVTNT